jgi:thiol-disulfide isomerase/thioredoxin
MAFIEQTSDDLRELLEVSPKTIVMFGRKGCGNCKLLKPYFKNISKNYTDVVFTYIDVDKLTESAHVAEYEHLPTFAVYEFTNWIGQDTGTNREIVDYLLDKLVN